MSFVRIIPTLLLKGSGLVKTQQFKNPVYIGDPINAVRIFNEKEVDELVLLDITATPEKQEPKYSWIKDIVRESFMPIGYGGGIQNAEQAKRLFDIGVEKIILNSAATNEQLIEQLAKIYGSQSIVVCIDVRKSLLGGYSCYIESGKTKIKYAPDEFARKSTAAGAGEIIIQSIDREGTMKGFDLQLIKSVCNAVNVPVVATGGAGSIDDLKSAVIEGKASAVAAGSLFVFKGKHRAVLINYPSEQTLKMFY